MNQPDFGTPEFSRLLDVRQCEGKHAVLEASETERAALAKRFDLVRVDRLEAALDLSRDGAAVDAVGTMTAHFVQSCAVSGEDLPVAASEPVRFRFVPESAPGAPDEELELDADELDEIPYSGTDIDLGEALAQSLGLAIDPYLAGPEADAARQRAGLSTPETSGPFAALAALKKGD